ncbi:MAG: glycosyltransferase [Rhodocyclaceae bacterium]|jgi:GT2 family glycosyltransferase|nr:glycosyltransferase [Rhodocyclaceae bacterium]MBK6906774.1 glycosyltransferase [Rhodocyclaceae bacterium]
MTIPGPVHLHEKVSIGMGAYGGAEMTEMAVQCLLGATTGDYELILVDNGSPDSTLEVFKRAAREHANTKIIHFPQNQEYVVCVNAILSHAQGERVIFLSNDYLTTPSWFKGILQSFEMDPTVGISCGTSNYCDNGGNPSRNLVNMNFSFADSDELFIFADGVAKAFAQRSLLDEPYFPGDGFGVRRELLDVIGTFDTNFVGYMGDFDFAVRCKKAGYRVVANQAAFAFHIVGGGVAHLSTAEQQARLDERFARARVAVNRFIDKYGLADVHPYVTELAPVSGLAELEYDAVQRARAEQLFVAPADYSKFIYRDSPGSENRTSSR